MYLRHCFRYLQVPKFLYTSLETQFLRTHSFVFPLFSQPLFWPFLHRVRAVVTTLLRLETAALLMMMTLLNSCGNARKNRKCHHTIISPEFERICCIMYLVYKIIYLSSSNLWLLLAPAKSTVSCQGMILCNWIRSYSHALQTCKHWKYTLQKNWCIRLYITTHISIIAALKSRDVPVTNIRSHSIGFLGKEWCRFLGAYHFLESKKKKY